MQEKHISIIAALLNIPAHKIQNTIQLLRDGATIPFISRYRKEMTGSLDEVQIGDIEKEMRRLDELEKRRESILNAIEEQGKLTDDLKKRILETYDSTKLEDLYLPYKRKRKTRASVAREKGLEPLATAVFEQRNHNVTQLASGFLNDQVPNVEEALQGARDIIAEWINEDEVARTKVRYAFAKDAVFSAKVARGKEEEGSKYQDYFEFEEPLKNCPSHRLLAIRRAEEEGILRVKIAPPEEDVLYNLGNHYLKGNGYATQQVQLALDDSYKRLLGPGIETEFRQSSKETADEEAIKVFVTNLQQLLLAAPLGQKRVLALDPGFRTGCKVVCLDESGNLLQHSTVYPHPPQSEKVKTIEELTRLCRSYKIEAIAIGNGTAGRETLTLLKQADLSKTIDIFLVNESGASIYSASQIAREEFPDKDVTVRGAISIGRRLLDPLAELVKIDAKSIGVGQYQHDVNQVKLKESLDRVVESCVNSVGINLNTASKHLLTYVSGLGPTLAANIVAYRQQEGQFTSRSQLKKVPRMGDKAFEQAAGFLRIAQAKNPLDNTAVHPESYPIVQQMAKDMNTTVDNLIKDASLRKQIKLDNYITETVGLPTLKDILKELEKPGLDPRGEAKTVEFAAVSSIDDLAEGMVLPGVVTNITNFGAFVDIGIKGDGLVHISQLANRFVKDPAEVVHLQQQVQVKVLEIDVKRGRVNLSMKEV
jgi:protein Tex